MLSLAIVLASGCGAQMSDFVHGVIDNKGPDQVLGPVVPGSPVQLSAGSTRVAGTVVSGRVSLTTSLKPLQGTHVDARISLHQSRTE